MSSLSVSLEAARRLALTKQALAGPRITASPKGVLEVARRIRCIQMDPINAIARTQHLVLFSRLGPRYRTSHLDGVAWKRKELFSYWAHAASYVLTEDYPIHSLRMRRWPEGESASADKVRKWVEANVPAQRHILSRIRKEGPLRSRDFSVKNVVPWSSTGWTEGQAVARVIDILWIKGKLMIAGRSGLDRVWDLADRWFPEWTPRDRMTEQQVVERAALYSLHALGVATQQHIAQYFTRNQYPGLKATLDRLAKKGEIVPVHVDPFAKPWWVAADDVEALERLADGEREPRTTLLSPFDNLIAHRARTKELFDFDYTIEIYVPKNKRRFGYYVLPILHDGRLIGRIDSHFDRNEGAYVVDYVYAEEGAPRDRATGTAVRVAIESLASWLEATSIRFGRADAWRSSLR